MSNRIKFQVIVDNSAANGLVAEHGYSLKIEAHGRTILFDTGNSGALLPNALALGFDLAGVSDLILSHGHYDHAGGVDDVLKRATRAQVYLHQAAIQPRYVSRDGAVKSVRMPELCSRALDRLPEERLHWVTGPYALSESIGLTGPVARETGFEDTGSAFFFDQQATRVDLIEDDISMWICTEEGLAVCVGCSHAGIVNILQAIMRITGETRVHTVIGGLHLMYSQEARLRETARLLNQIGLKRLVACHCTGDDAIDYLGERLSGEVTRGYAGMELII